MDNDITCIAEQALDRILLRKVPAQSSADWNLFEWRLREQWPTLFPLLLELYGSKYDFFYHIEELVQSMSASWSERSGSLKALDATREQNASWFQSNHMVGAVAYVDLWAKDLSGLKTSIPYLKNLGVTYLHLMPLFEVPEDHNDGGYAVSSFRRVREDIGTMEELSNLATELRANDISLVLDFVFNHTSDEHEWAQRAKSGDSNFQSFYYMFPDRTMPDAYERTLRDIFPTVRHGSFTFDEALQKWIWTTFHSFQWDLNYSNPEVFRAMAGEMLFLANAGVEILRLDAVAFIWKRLGTACENEPEAHKIIRAFNCIARIAAPALLFKSEAIVHPDDVLSYLAPQECQLSYNPLLMALLWETLATREVRLLERSLQRRHALPDGCAWINYARSHDDIGWTFDDEDARQVGIDPVGHRKFLNEFYTGSFPGSFARGVPFQENQTTGDCRISGTLASLAGLEEAVTADNDALIDLAVARILLLHAIILSAGGIPLLYLGDENAQLNDYGYLDDSAKADDSRWIHRPRSSFGPAAGPAARIRESIMHLLQQRINTRAFAGNTLEVVPTGNPHVLAYQRIFDSERVLVVSNFSERQQSVNRATLRPHLDDSDALDLISGRLVEHDTAIVLAPYQSLWLKF